MTLSGMGRLESESLFAGNLNTFELTKGKAHFDPTGDRWAYRDGVYRVSLDFLKFILFSKSLIDSAKSVLVWYAKFKAPKTLDNTYQALLHFHNSLRQRSNSIAEITEIELLNYRATLNKRNLYRFGVLAGVLKRWADFGYSGISSGALKLIKQLRTPGNPKGEAVLTWDPAVGPLTEVEFEALHCAMNEAYASAVFTAEQYLLAWLCIALGQRPVQYSSLKVCDVLPPESDDRHLGYNLNMPRAKNSDTNSRGSFTKRPIIQEVGDALSAHAANIKAEFAGRLPDASLAPLFPSRGREQWSAGFEFHQTAEGISRVIKSLLSKLNIHSERVDGVVKLLPIRLRRTLGTRAAAEGHGAFVIAELLDHSDIQNVGVYSANSPAIIERIDRAVAMQLAPLAQAFSGLLIRDESEATRGKHQDSRIIDLRIDRSGAPMGSCSQYSFCGFSAPVACYTCKAFEPWLDGPHEAVLNHLLGKRMALMATTDMRIAAVNDRTILAVAEVVLRVNVAKGKVNE